MKRLRPFFSFYGAKWSIINYYPKPIHGTIVEPFAGSANYALRYHDRKIVLNELDDVVYRIWDYLIRVSEQEILALPDMEPEQCVHDLPICEEARFLIGFWMGRGLSYPLTQPGIWMQNRKYHTRCQWWGRGVRERIAGQLKHIRHWRIENTSYCQLPNIEATHFVDPPYVNGGQHYRLNSINYFKLSFYCQTRTGQTIVCENQHGKWLDFTPLVKLQGTRKKSVEHLYHRISR